VAPDQLAARHFTAQDALPDGVAAVDVRRLSSVLRGLLLLDGTVSRALEAETLRPVQVEPVAHDDCEPSAAVAAALQLASGERCMRRRVVMRIAGASPIVWAESFVVPERLPAAFLNALTANAKGIGGSLQELRLESARELLWFGLAGEPDWPEPAGSGAATLRRAYLLFTGGEPALLITEDFAVDENDGVLSLAGAGADG
jgi:chorismate-pyruvate lyase